MAEINRNIPLSVRTALRQEAHFGCCECGNPILDFHHIVPWVEVKQHNTEHMIALCPTHHRDIAKRSREHAYGLKKSPYNKRVGRFQGELATDKEKPSFIMGTNTFVRTPVIFSYYGTPIFSYRIFGGQNLISTYLPDQDFWPEIEIIDNDIVARSSSFWDIEFATNYVRFRKGRGDIFLEIDFRGEDALVSGSFYIGDQHFRFSPKATNFAGVSIRHCTMIDCAGGFFYGDDQHRLIRPNFAMIRPRGFLTRKKA